MRTAKSRCIPVPESGEQDKEDHMKQQIYDEKNGLTYTLVGDY